MKFKGFSIVEASIALLIIGVLGMGVLSSYSEQDTHAKWLQSDKKLELVRKALIEFARTNRYLPCPSPNLNGLDGRVADTGTIPNVPATPAIPAVPATATAPTIPAVPAIPATGTQNNVPVNTCPVSIGFVPYEAIGLSQAHARDAWGNTIRYAINPGAMDPNRMLTCPDDSACFFSNRQVPAFNLQTPPVVGNPGIDNLRVCGAGVNDCNAATAQGDVVADNALLVLVAFNENGSQAPAVGSAEADNNDNDLFYIQGQYSQAPHFDDLIKIVSATDIKERDEMEVVIFDSSGGGTPFDVASADGDIAIAGGTGDNNRFSDSIGINIASQTIDVGAEYARLGLGAATDLAGKEVTLTFDAKVSGGWEDAGVNGGTPDTDGDGNLETQDRFLVGINGDDVSDLDGTLSNLDESVARFDNHEVTESFFYDEDLDTDNTWYEKVSINTTLDEYGQLNIDFAVFSTEPLEKVDISNISVSYYGQPGSPPPMPSISMDVDLDENGIIDSGESLSFGGN